MNFNIGHRWQYSSFKNNMRLQIKPAKISDLKAYTDLLQKTYQKAYTNNYRMA
jgi:hypothetical protein